MKKHPQGRLARRIAAVGGLALVLAAGASHAACSVNIGVLLALTGSMAEIGQDNLRSAQLAVKDVNAAGGVGGCTIKPIVADTETEPSVAVNQAKSLIDLRGVRVIFGSNSSGTTIAELRSVTAPSKVLLVSPSAASTSFTELAKKGYTKGLFYRGVMSVGGEGPVVAYVARHMAGWKHVSIVYVNNAFGVTYAKETIKAFEAMGGKARLIPYNSDQPDYQSIVTDALRDKPQALVLLAHPKGGQAILRDWLQAGGPQHVLLADSVATENFVEKSGGKLLDGGWTVKDAAVKTPWYELYRKNFEMAYKRTPHIPYDTNSYDAMAITLLAMDQAGTQDAHKIFAAAREITAPGGLIVHPTPAGFKAALAAIAQGKKIHYVGVTGALSIDQYGDVSNPVVIGRVKGGKLDYYKTLGVDEVDNIVKHHKL